MNNGTTSTTSTMNRFEGIIVLPGNFHRREQFSDTVVRAPSFHLYLGMQQYPVPEHGESDLPHIIGCHELTPVEHCLGFRREQQHDTRSRTRPERYLRHRSRTADNASDVAPNVLLDVKVPHDTPQFHECRPINGLPDIRCPKIGVIKSCMNLAFGREPPTT